MRPSALLLAGLAASAITASSIADRPAADVIARLNLTANVEKGFYTQTFVDPLTVAALNGSSCTSSSASNARSASTAIYYLLKGSAGDSVWHRLNDAVEVWHYYAGAPLVLSLARDDGSAWRRVTLGPDVFAEDQVPQVVIASGDWQSARSLGKWTLVGTTGTSRH
jgi:uncharacterized protein